MSSVRAVVFDMDGLLLDTERLSRASWFAAGRDLGVELPMPVLQRIIGRRRAEVEAQFLAALGDTFPVGELYARHSVHYQQALAATSPGELRKPGVLSLLAWLDGAGIPYAIATSTLAAAAATKLALADLSERFPVVVTGEQVARSKPAPDIYLEAANRLGVSPARCVAFEDSDLGLEAAMAAGMRAVAVPDLKPVHPEITSRVAATLRSLEDAVEMLEPLMVSARSA